jgi:hypothetical protein
MRVEELENELDTARPSSVMIGSDDADGRKSSDKKA